MTSSNKAHFNLGSGCSQWKSDVGYGFYLNSTVEEREKNQGHFFLSDRPLSLNKSRNPQPIFIANTLIQDWNVLDLMTSLVLCVYSFLTWSWPCPELHMKLLLGQYLRLVLGSTYGKFWVKKANFEVYTIRKLKTPDFDIWPDLYLTLGLILKI